MKKIDYSEIVKRISILIITAILYIAILLADKYYFVDKYYTLGWVCVSNSSCVFWICFVAAISTAGVGLKYTPFVSIVGFILGVVLGEMLGKMLFVSKANTHSGWFLFIVTYFIIFIASSFVEIHLKHISK